jgi:hypothetical protein
LFLAKVPRSDVNEMSTKRAGTRGHWRPRTELG